MPIGSSDDSMVKVASETVSSAKFYERFLALVELFLPPEAKKAAHITEKPKTDLGVPEAKAAPAQLAPTPAAEPAPAPAAEPAPVETAPASSEPVVPPAETAPITPAQSSEPSSSTESGTPPADSSTMPAPTEPISAMPVSGQ
jgi:hypothetical protein